MKRIGGYALQNTRRNFLASAAEIIRSVAHLGFICYVPYKVFDVADKTYALKETVGSAYGLAGAMCAALCREWARRKWAKGQKVRFVFEDGGPDKEGLDGAFEHLGLRRPEYAWSREHINKKTGETEAPVIELQAADYLAYEARKGIVDYMKTKQRKVRGSLSALCSKIIIRAFAGPEKVRATCTVLKIPVRTQNEN